MGSWDELDAEPPISRAGDGRLLYRPILSVSEGHWSRGPYMLRSEPPTSEVVLIDPEDFDRPVEVTAEDRAAAASIDDALAPLRSHFAEVAPAGEGEGASAVDELPKLVDHRPHHSAIKNQGKRNTCVAHASMALLESMPQIPDDLSEQYAHYKFMTFLNIPQREDRAFVTTDAARFLARGDGLVSAEEAWPYIALQSDIVRLVDAGEYAPPPPAVADQTYGFASYKLIEAGDGTGESINNVRYLETLLAAGFDIAVGSWVSWDERENTSVMGLVTDRTTGEPIRRAGHAMLIVGYDRPHQYFILKNSWGFDWGHAGYGYFGYDVASAAFKYGFTVSAALPSP